MDVMQKGERWRTNSASKILGLSILLDPMTHDNIRGEWLVCSVFDQ